MYKKNDALKRFAAFVMALLMIFNMADFVPEIAIAIAEGEVIPEQQETPPVNAENTVEAPAPAAEDPVPAPAAEDAPAAEEPAPAPAPAAEDAPAAEESAPAPAPAAEDAPAAEEPVPAPEVPAADSEPSSDESAPEVPAADSAPSSDEPAQETPATDSAPSSDEPAQEALAADSDTSGKESAPAAETSVTLVTESIPVEEVPVVESAPVEKESTSDEGKQKGETPAVNETESDGEDEQKEAPAEKESALDEENKQDETPAVDETESNEEDQQKDATAENESELEEENKLDETTAKDVTESEEAGQQDDNSVEEETVLEKGTLTADAADKEIDPVTAEAAAETPVNDETIQAAEEDTSAGQGIRPVINTELAAAPAVPTVKAAVPETPAEDTEGLLIITSNTSETQAETQTINKEEAAVEITADTATETVPAAEESSETAAIPRTVQIQVGNYVFTATGDIPEGAEIQAVEIPADTAKQLTGRKNMLFAYDIRLVVDGQVWQPEDYGKDVQISVQDINDPLKSKDISILHVKTDILQEDGSLSEEALKKAVEDLPEGNVESEKIATGASDGVVSFETTSFSPFLAAQATLQEIFDRALASSIKEGKASGTLQIELEAETEYEGDTVLEVNSETATVGDDFKVDIVAPNAGSDNLQADGTTMLSGNVTIRGIKVRMVGINIAAGKKITVMDSGKLEYYGTQDADTLDVEVRGDTASANIQMGAGNDTVTAAINGGTADIQTGADDDTVNANVQKGSATVRTAEGKDTVTAVVNDGDFTADTSADDDNVSATVRGGSVSIQSGEDNDTVTADMTGGKATIRTGAGDDRVTAKVSGNHAQSTLDIETNAGDDTVSVTNDAYNSMVTVATGDGIDSVEVDAHVVKQDTEGIKVDAGAGNDTVTLKNTGGAPQFKGKIFVELGTDNDTANVDTALSTAVSSVIVKGHKDSRDTVHFTGTLVKWEDKNPPVVQVSVEDITGGNAPKKAEEIKKITLNPSGSPLVVELSEINSLTDSLGNKRTIDLTKEQVESGYTANDYFVDYHVNFPAKDIRNLKITSDKYLPLSNLLINTASDGVLTIDKDAVIDVRGLNLTLNSDKIDVKGKLLANTVSLNAIAGNNKINVQRETKINIADTGRIYAAGDVSIQANASMSGPMLDINGMMGIAQSIINGISDGIGIGDFDPNNTAYLNVVNVKLAKASVEIAGKVYAGVSNLDDIAENLSTLPALTNDQGSVNVKAETSVTMGKSDGSPINGGLPVGVSVANVEAKVSVLKGAVIGAAQDVSIASKSTLKAGTRAKSGLAGAPVAVAVAVLMNDVHTTVKGQINADKGDARITAEGTLQAATWADHGSGHTSLSGGFAAVTVALQDVSAVVGSDASVKAGGSITVHSSAEEKVDDKAATTSLGDGASGDGLIHTVGGWLVKLKNWLVEKFRKAPSDEQKIQNALKLLPVSDRSVMLDSKAQAKGQASVEKTDNGQTVKLTVKPWEGYKVKSVMVRGYTSGVDTWGVKQQTREEGKNVDGKIVFDLPLMGSNGNIIYVEYEEDNEGQSDDAWQPSDLFVDDNRSSSTDDDDDDPDTWRPSDLFNLDDVVGGVQDGTHGTDGEAGEGTVELHRIGVVTYDFLPGSPKKNLEKVNPGDTVRVLPNPGDNQKVRKVEATYTVKEKVEEDGKEKEEEVVKTVELTRDAQGRYIFNVPETFEKEKGVTITAEFDAGAAGTSGNTTQTQVNGTVAVTVARNDSQALIESGATVGAGGAVDVSSETRTDVNTYADGSSASKPGSGGGGFCACCCSDLSDQPGGE